MLIIKVLVLISSLVLPNLFAKSGNKCGGELLATCSISYKGEAKKVTIQNACFTESTLKYTKNNTEIKVMSHKWDTQGAPIGGVPIDFEEGLEINVTSSEPPFYSETHQFKIPMLQLLQMIKSTTQKKPFQIKIRSLSLSCYQETDIDFGSYFLKKIITK